MSSKSEIPTYFRFSDGAVGIFKVGLELNPIMFDTNLWYFIPYVEIKWDVFILPDGTDVVPTWKANSFDKYYFEFAKSHNYLVSLPPLSQQEEPFLGFYYSNKCFTYYPCSQK